MAKPRPGPVRLEERDGFRFRGGHPALDLTATLAGRLKPAPIERLQTTEDLGRWLVAAGLASTPPVATAADLDQARALREAIYALVNARLDEQRPAPGVRETINRIAAEAAAIPRLDAHDRIELDGPAGAFLATVAREAVHLLGGPDARRIRQCISPTCTLLFLDMSRAGDRRWCSMSGCGNKAKVTEFRRRRKLGEDGDRPD